MSGRHRAHAPERTGVLWWCGQIAAWLILLSILSVATIMIVIPRIAGATAYTVLTASMEPEMPPGSLAVIRPQDPATLRTGDVITFQAESGKASVITHRIVGVGSTLGGELRFTTRGDANSANDPQVLPEQVRGSLWYQVPLLGHLNSALNGSQRQWLTIAAIAGLLGYSTFMAVSALRDRFQRSKTL